MAKGNAPSIQSIHANLLELTLETMPLGDEDILRLMAAVIMSHLANTFDVLPIINLNGLTGHSASNLNILLRCLLKNGYDIAEFDRRDDVLELIEQFEASIIIDRPKSLFTAPKTRFLETVFRLGARRDSSLKCMNTRQDVSADRRKITWPELRYRSLFTSYFGIEIPIEDVGKDSWMVTIPLKPLHTFRCPIVPGNSAKVQEIADEIARWASISEGAVGQRYKKTYDVLPDDGSVPDYMELPLLALACVAREMDEDFDLGALNAVLALAKPPRLHFRDHIDTFEHQVVVAIDSLLKRPGTKAPGWICLADLQDLLHEMFGVNVPLNKLKPRLRPLGLLGDAKIIDRYIETGPGKPERRTQPIHYQVNHNRLDALAVEYGLRTMAAGNGPAATSNLSNARELAQSLITK